MNEKRTDYIINILNHIKNLNNVTLNEKISLLKKTMDDYKDLINLEDDPKSNKSYDVLGRNIANKFNDIFDSIKITSRLNFDTVEFSCGSNILFNNVLLDDNYESLLHTF